MWNPKRFLIMRTISIVLLITFIIISCKSVGTDTEMVTLNFIDSNISIALPPQHILKREQYEEGIIYYIYTKEGYIIVTEGANMLFSIDHYSSKNMKHKSHLYQSGIENNSYWRKESLGRIRIYGNTHNANKHEIKSINRICNSIRKE